MDRLNSTDSAVFERGEKKQVFDQLVVLLHFSQYYLTHVPNVAKQLWIYTQGLIHLALLFYFGNKDHTTQKWVTWFQQMQVTPTTYKFEAINHLNAVYIKCPADIPETKKRFHQQQMFYIGSTKVGLCHREYNRNTQVHRFKQGKAIQVELAIRWWTSQNNYHTFSTIAIKHFDTYAEAWTYEHAIIEQLKAPLNHPLVSKHLTRNAFRYFYKPDKSKFQGISSSFRSFRLFRRIRRRIQTLKQSMATIPELRLETWKIMYNLASYNKQRFLTSKELRSGKYTDTMVYGFIRLSSHVEEPEKSRIRSELKRIAAFRNMTWPMMTSKPLQIPFLAPPNFAKNLKRWLKRFLRTRKHLAIPFHLPKGTVREAAHTKVADALYNPFNWNEYDVFNFDTLPCPCETVLQQHPRAENIEGHICATLDQFELPSQLRILQHINSYSTVFPTKGTYLEDTVQSFKKWLKKHGLPIHDLDDFRTFLENEWSSHLRDLQETPRLTIDHISMLKEFLGAEVVIHHADHQNQNARVFCPQLYFRGCKNTWTDPELFTMLDCTPQQAIEQVQKLATVRFQKQYIWGINWGATLPQGFIFLKMKKQFKKGRTIISYKGSTYANLLKYAANALEAMLKQVWPQSLGQYSIPEIWKATHMYFQTVPEETDLHTLNDDLIGFFNSVPQSKLLQAVHTLVKDWYNMYGTETIQVEVNKNNFHTQNITAGRPNRNNFDTSRTRTINIHDLPKIVQLSFDSCIFETMGRIFRQHRGTGIGNQISPVVSNIAVTLIERVWYASFQQQLQGMQRTHSMLMLRYVDNRFALFPANLVHKKALTLFCHKHFYQLPVELEDVGTNELLGFDVDANNRTIQYRQPDQPWKIRDVTSAGSWNLRLSGLRSRATLIARYSWPRSTRRLQIAKLIEQYVKKGFSRSRCKQVVFDLLSK